jgi:hypothetical protein
MVKFIVLLKKLQSPSRIRLTHLKSMSTRAASPRPLRLQMWPGAIRYPTSQMLHRGRLQRRDAPGRERYILIFREKDRTHHIEPLDRSSRQQQKENNGALASLRFVDFFADSPSLPHRRSAAQTRQGQGPSHRLSGHDSTQDPQHTPQRRLLQPQSSDASQQQGTSDRLGTLFPIAKWSSIQFESILGPCSRWTRYRRWRSR